MYRLHFSHNWRWNKKNGLTEPIWTSFYLFPKKVSELFPSPNNVLVIKSSVLVQLCSFLVAMLQFSHNWWWNEKNGLNKPFWTSFYLFPKKYPRSMRLNFFDHRTLFWTPNLQFISICAHFWCAGSNLAIIRDKIRKLDWGNHFGQGFNYLQKSIRARWGLTFSITEHCFGHQNIIFTLAIIGDEFKKLDWPNHFGLVFFGLIKSSILVHIVNFWTHKKSEHRPFWTHESLDIRFFERTIVWTWTQKLSILERTNFRLERTKVGT